MRGWIVTGVVALIALVIATATWTYSVKHESEQRLAEIRKLERLIALEHETIDLLRADWAHLSHPQRLQALAGEVRTMVFYESSHRIAESLADMAAIFGGERPAVLARELTKLFETVLDGSLGTLLAQAVAAREESDGRFAAVTDYTQAGALP